MTELPCKNVPLIASVGSSCSPRLTAGIDFGHRTPYLTAAGNYFCARPKRRVNILMTVPSIDLPPAPFFTAVFHPVLSFLAPPQAASLWARSPRCWSGKPCSSWRRSAEVFRRCSRTTTKSSEVVINTLIPSPQSIFPNVSRIIHQECAITRIMKGSSLDYPRLLLKATEWKRHHKISNRKTLKVRRPSNTDTLGW